MTPFKMNITSEMEQYRHDTWKSKEPETIRWIDAFGQGNFFDVGANVGIYSMYAAFQSCVIDIRKKKTIPTREIYSFEPHEQNFIALLENKHLNDFQNIHCIPFAVGMDTKVVDLHHAHNEVGGSGSQIGKPIDDNGNAFEATQTIPTMCISLVDFCRIYRISIDYLKIDIDGLEMSVLMGADYMLSKVKSLLVEINGNQVSVREVTAMLEHYDLFPDPRINLTKPHSCERRQGSPYNVVYTREGGLEI